MADQTKNTSGRPRLTGMLWSAALVAGVSAMATPAHGEADPVVLTVGTHTTTVSEVSRHASRMPLFQLRDMGNDAPGGRAGAIRRSLINDLARADLLVQAARDAKLDQRPDVRERIQGVLRSAILNDIRQHVMTTQTVSDADVKKFYDANKTRYTPQKRLKLWQIVVGSKQEAEAILNIINTSEAFKKAPVEEWDKLCRKHSLDKSTAMRKGNVGLVNPDGSTKHKDVSVSPMLHQAASRVKDGQVVPTPIKAGNYWVIVMRRGSLETPLRELAAEAPTIRNMLQKRRVQKAARELVEKLRAAELHEIHPQRVDHVVLDEFGELTTRQRPGAVRHRRPVERSNRRPLGRPLR